MPPVHAVRPRSSRTRHSGWRNRVPHGQDVLTQPFDQRGHLVGQVHGLRFGLTGVTQLRRQRQILATLTVFAAGLTLLQSAAGGDGVVAAILQVTDQRRGRVQGVEDIAATRRVGQSLRLAGT